MADALVSQSDEGAVVIAGTGHVRNDIGIPVHMAIRAPGRRLISVGFIEVDAGLLTATGYTRPPVTALFFDYAWFMSAAERADPCAGLSGETMKGK